ncbi:hypothetical protein C0991_004888 [Blastosporella zonata]|nr:hypothetical protein C0991_004888 [Blastosporella zonata]
MNASDVFQWFAPGFGNLANVKNPLTSPVNTPVMGSIMALVVQIFFCYRISVINREAWWWCLFIGAVSIVQAVAGIVGGIKVPTFIRKLHEEINQNIPLWLVGDVVADIMIAATMTFSLLRASPGKHRQTNDAVTRIVRLTVETNTLTTAVAIISMALFVAAPHLTTLLIGFHSYANTLLVTFNNRAFLAKKMQSSSYVASSVNQSRVPGNFPISAGLKFSENADYDENVEHIMITQQSTTVGDTESGGYGNRTYDKERPL